MLQVQSELSCKKTLQLSSRWVVYKPNQRIPVLLINAWIKSFTDVLRNLFNKSYILLIKHSLVNLLAELLIVADDLHQQMRVALLSRKCRFFLSTYENLKKNISDHISDQKDIC